MSRLPVCSGADAVKAFAAVGYTLDHQTGSHIILRHPSGRRNLAIGYIDFYFGIK